MEARVSTQQMQAAIPKIERRITELEAFDPLSVNERSDPRIEALGAKLDTLLIDIFGANTIEYFRYRHIANLDTASINIYGTDISEVRDGLRRGKESAITMLQTVRDQFREELEDAGLTASGRALRAYEGLELHPAIERAASGLYKDGHYSNAIEDSVKALNSLVKLHSGVVDRDGTQLMEYVFNPKSPVLKFNSLSTESERNEQRGFMMLFSGAVAGLRNPRAHDLIKDDPEETLEFIALISLLAKLADKAR